MTPSLITAPDDLDPALILRVAGGGGVGGWVSPARGWGPGAGMGGVGGPPGGGRVPAAEALRSRGLGAFSLGPREGHALLAGVPGATALSLLRLADARALESVMEAAAALSIAAPRASRHPYAAACARGDDILVDVLSRLRAAIGENPEPRALQAPVSFRV